MPPAKSSTKVDQTSAGHKPRELLGFLASCLDSGSVRELEGLDPFLEPGDLDHIAVAQCLGGVALRLGGAPLCEDLDWTVLSMRRSWVRTASVRPRVIDVTDFSTQPVTSVTGRDVRRSAGKTEAAPHWANDPSSTPSALRFFPRGGSSHVARALARELPSHGWDVTVVSGSRRDLEGVGDAARFYAGLDVYPVSFDEALASPDPLIRPLVSRRSSRRMRIAPVLRTGCLPCWTTTRTSVR